MTEDRVRAVVVEDEPLARRALRDLISQLDWMELVGEAADGITAVSLIDGLRPELVFLDVRLPELSGLQVLERISHEPEVIFTTAYDRYAVTAFELGAIDYLMKPFGPERFHRAMRRLEARWPLVRGAATTPERVREVLAPTPYLSRLFVREASAIRHVHVSDAVRFEAADDYVVLHLPDRTHVLSTTLNSLEERLDSERFLRVHRSHIVNLDHVVEMTPCDRRLSILLSDGSEVLSSRARTAELRRQLT